MPGLFYIDALPDIGELAVVDGDEGFHAATVRRIRVGEELILGDGAGNVARCVVEETARDGLKARVQARRQVAPARPQVTVVQALPKSERSELAVELATEAGATRWWPGRPRAAWPAGTVPAPRRVCGDGAQSPAPRPSSRDVPTSRRSTACSSTAALVSRIGEVTSSGGVVLALHEAAVGPLTDLSLAPATSLVLVVGPEGGIAPDELAAIVEAGANAVRLGPTVLRTSTAAAVALGALGAH